MRNYITQDRLKERVVYDPDTGDFRWRVDYMRKCVRGRVCGTINRSGYRTMMVDGTVYAVHRLAWFYVHGYWPMEIDHKNMLRSDNRLCNLRDTTRKFNRANTLATGSYRKGVRKHGRGFQARIKQDGVLVTLGVFDTEDQAAAAYWQAAQQWFGEFARI